MDNNQNSRELIHKLACAEFKVVELSFKNENVINDIKEIQKGIKDLYLDESSGLNHIYTSLGDLKKHVKSNNEDEFEFLKNQIVDRMVFYRKNKFKDIDS